MRYRNLTRAAGVLLIVLACGYVAPTLAQLAYPYPTYTSSTAAGDAAQGMASVISSKGDYNLQSSQAAINMTQAQSQEIANREQWTKTYFENKTINEQWQQAHREKQATPEQLARMAQIGMPKRLTPSELNLLDGKIVWPVALQDDQYAQQRQQIAGVFNQRAQTGTTSLEQINLVRSLTGQMTAMLKQGINSMPTATFMSAKHFLESLAFEAQSPPT